MKKLLYAVLGLVIVVIAAVLLAPQFIDVNIYKPEIQSRFKAALGYDLDMKGEIKLSFFPTIKATVKDVSVFNDSKNLVNIEQITAYPKLRPLLAGKLQFDSVRLDAPVVMLEKNENGDNWTLATAPTAAVKADDRLNVQVTSVDVVDGKISYADKVKKRNYDVGEADLKAVVTSAKGPVGFDGAVKYNGEKVDLKGRVEDLDAPKLAVVADVIGSEVSFDGAVGGGGAAGKFAVKSKDVDALAEFLKIDEIRHLGKIPVDVSGEVNYGEKAADFKNLKLMIGDTKGGGDFNFAVDGSISAGANLKFEMINLDQLLPKTAATAKKPDDGAAHSDSQKDISAEIDLTADSVVYGGVTYKDLVVKSTSDRGEISVQPFSFKFPKSGGAEIFGVLSHDTEGRFFEGHINADSANLSDILKSFKLDPDGLKSGALRSFKLDSELVVNLRDKVSAELSKTTLTVDNSLFQGNISLDINALPGVDINGTINAIDLDKYVAPLKSVLAAGADKPKATGPTDDKPFRIGWLEGLPFKASANILVGKLTYAGDDYNNLRLRGNCQPETLNITEMTLSGKKIQLAAKGSVYAYAGKKVKVNIEANLGKVNTADFINQEAVTEPRPQDKTRWSKQPFDLSFLRKIDFDFSGNLGSFIHNKFIFDNAVIKGYIENGKLVLEDSSVDMFGGKININGSIEATAVPSLRLAYSGVGVDANRLLEVLIDNKRVNGKVNFSGSLSSSGIYQMAMINNLEGSIGFAANNLAVKGFNLDGMAEQITNTNNIADVSSITRTVSGEDAVTYLKSVSGALVFENGIARNQADGIQMMTASGPGLYSGKGDILNWNMDSNAVFKLVMSGSTATPAVSIHIFGPLNEPAKDINLDEVRRYISGRGAKLLLNDNSPTPQVTTTPPAVATEPAPQAAPLVNPNDRFAAARARVAAQKAARVQRIQQMKNLQEQQALPPQ